jgi:hypothetical protein
VTGLRATQDGLAWIPPEEGCVAVVDTDPLGLQSLYILELDGHALDP